MAKIDTSITTGSITSINKTPSVSVGSGGRVIDSNAQILAKTLSSVNSALGDYVVKKEKEKAENDREKVESFLHPRRNAPTIYSPPTFQPPPQESRQST